jgi:Tol biopolymer transport system component/DNA-binding winged helix-turn-helix (wHTH) protein
MIARFSDFELDTEQCRLSRAGEPLRLEKMPLDLLILLVQRHDELVKREEITAALWGSSASGVTFVDAEHGINTAIRKIRGVLDDDPAKPRHIETVVRRGYRFKGPIEIASTVVAPEPSLAPTLAPVPAKPAVSSQTWSSQTWLLALGGLVVLAAVAALSARRDAPTMPMLRWTPLTREVHTFMRLASDGNKVFWTEGTGTGCQILSVPVAGGESTPVKTPFKTAVVMDATAGHHLLINPRDYCRDTLLQGPLWELALDTGEIHRVGDLTGQDATYSPDGRRIAVAKGNQIIIANRDGSDAKRIAVLPSLIWTMHWSPDASRLRFSLFEGKDSRFRLWETLADGTQSQPLLADWKDSSEKLGGVWINPTDFLFAANRKGSVDLWRMRRGNVEQVTAGPLDFDAPTNIPGVNQVAIVGTHRQGELQRFDAAAHQFVPFLKGLSAHMMDFSRDGKWIAYVSYPDGALWRSRADGSEPLQLTRAPWRTGMPRISPDSTQIAFTGDTPGKPLRVYLISIDGGTPKPVIPESDGGAQVAPTWSPDGSRLLLRYDQPGSDTAFQNDILEIVDWPSHRITTVPGSAKKFNQRWSPDGKWIIATPNSGKEIDAFELATGQWTVLAKVDAGYPEWSPDSKFVYFCGASSIYRLALATRRTELVASLEHIDRAMDEVWSQWSGLAPDGSPLILKSADLQQIYSLSFEK